MPTVGWGWPKNPASAASGKAESPLPGCLTGVSGANRSNLLNAGNKPGGVGMRLGFPQRPTSSAATRWPRAWSQFFEEITPHKRPDSRGHGLDPASHLRRLMNEEHVHGGSLRTLFLHCIA